MTNQGPNPASEVQVTDVLPPELEWIDLPEFCVEEPLGTATCHPDELLFEESVTFDLGARVTADLDCNERQTTFFTNIAEVTNLAGPDPRPENNRASERTEVLCTKYEYSAKVLCGRQDNPNDLRLATGTYASSINIHNPNDNEVSFFKKLALAFPPAEQTAGRVIPLRVDSLAYDEALKTDCNELLARVPDDLAAPGYIDGFIVIQSPHSLDVTGVYTTATLGNLFSPPRHTSVDVEQIHERVREPHTKLPDLIVESIDTFNISCVEGICFGGLSFTIRNIGPADAEGAFSVQVTVGPNQSVLGTEEVPGGLAAGATQTISLSGQANCSDPDCTILVTVDPAPPNRVPELNEDNNELEANIS